VAFAAHRYDVLVLRAVTHREGLAPLVGSLTGKLVELLDCDFILVKPSAYRCPISSPVHRLPIAQGKILAPKRFARELIADEPQAGTRLLEFLA